MRCSVARALALALVFPALAISSVQAAEPGEVNIYSYRQPYLIDPLLEEFTDETGIKVNVIFAEKGLIERIQAEGRNSPADLLLTVDVGNLTQATDAGIAQPIKSAELATEIPPAYRAADGQWIGLTRRARVVRTAEAPRRSARRPGSAGRAAAGAVSIGSAVGAAMTGRRVLGPAEARIMGAAGVVLLVLGLLALLWPRAVAVPLAVLALWLAGSLLCRAWILRSGRGEEPRDTPDRPRVRVRRRAGR